MAQATPTSQIRQLQTPDGTVNVFPITIEEAIHDSDGVQLSTKLAEIETETQILNNFSIVNGMLCVTYKKEV